MKKIENWNRERTSTIMNRWAIDPDSNVEKSMNQARIENRNPNGIKIW